MNPESPPPVLANSSDVQPPECMFGGEDIKERFPLVHGAVETVLQRWVSSGFAARAGLGWPLDISGGEFISINKWPFSNNASCVLADIFADHGDIHRAVWSMRRHCGHGWHSVQSRRHHHRRRTDGVLEPKREPQRRAD